MTDATKIGKLSVSIEGDTSNLEAGLAIVKRDLLEIAELVERINVGFVRMGEFHADIRKRHVDEVRSAVERGEISTNDARKALGLRPGEEI